MADSSFCAGCLRDDEQNKAESWCSDCTELVCKTCAKVHKRFSPPHKVIPIQQVTSLTSSIQELSKNCDLHHDQKIILFCYQHDQVVCALCLPELHQNCKSLTALEKAAEGVLSGTAIESLERRMENLGEVMENILADQTKNCTSLDEQRQTMKERVTEIRQKINLHLDNIEKIFDENLCKSWKSCKEKVEKDKNDVKNRYSELCSWRQDIKSLKEHASDVHLFRAVKFLDGKTNKEEAAIQKIQKQLLTQELEFTESKNISNIESMLSSFGTLDVKEKPCIMLATLDFEQQGQYFVRANTQQKSVQLLHSFKTEKLGQNIRISTGCFIPDNRIILAQTFRQCLHVCKPDGSQPRKIKVDYSPQYVAYVSNNAAFVGSSVEGVDLFNTKSLETLKFIPIPGGSWSVSSFNNKVVISSNKEKKLTVIDLKGKVQKEIPMTESVSDICVSSSGSIYCSVEEDDHVYFISPDGKHGVFYSNDELRNPLGITEDKKGFVYIAGNESNNIHRVSRDQKLSEIILNDTNGIRKPSGLSYNPERNEFMVINDGWTSVNIYKLPQ